MRAPGFVLLTCSLLVLAGCGGKPPPSATSGSPGVGRVEGRVLDDASAVVAGASVRVLLTQRSVLTDEQGSFRIENVPAGPIRVVAAADGFSSQTKGAVLQANGKAILSFVLKEVARVQPRHETIPFSDEIFCGFAAGASCPQDPAADPEQTAKVHPFEVAPDLRGIVFELEWTPPASGVNNNLAFDVHAASPNGCGARYHGALGEPVLTLVVLEGFPVSGGNQCVIVRPPGNQFTVQQTYTMHVTLFYHEPPPEGFTALSA